MSLLTALKSGDERLVETICSSGASPNTLEDGASPMHFLVGQHVHNVIQLTKILLQYGGDPNVENEEKLTPLHVSVMRGNAKVLRLLLRNGGDPTKKDEDGKDAWDHALKYGRHECQKVLLDYMDEETLAGSDHESDQYVSIFCPEVPVSRANESSDLSGLSASSQLNRGFVGSSNTTPGSDQVTSPESNNNLVIDVVDYHRETPPRPPPRRRSKCFKPQDLVTCSCEGTVSTANHPNRQELSLTQRKSSNNGASAKPHRTLLSAIKKSLSPGSKSDVRDRVGSSMSPSTSLSSSSTKSKSRSPLAVLLRSPSKTSQLTRMNSFGGQTQNTVRFDLKPQSRFTRSHSVPSRALMSSKKSVERDKRMLVDHTLDSTTPSRARTSTKSNSPRKRLNMENVDRHKPVYSPSNYTSTAGKPEKEKKLESPFQLKRRKSKNLFKRLLGSTPTSPDDNSPGSISIGLGQTVSLSERNPRDSVSILSLESGDRRSEENGCCMHCTSADCCGPVKDTIDSDQMADIEAGRKVFDVTSPDHCRVVSVDSSDTSPLEATLLYKSPPPKPQRLFLTSEFSVHQPAAGLSSTPSLDVVDCQVSVPPPIRRSASESNSQTHKEILDIPRTYSQTVTNPPYRTVNLPRPYSNSPAHGVDFSSATKPSDLVRSRRGSDAFISPSARGDLRGSLTAELQEVFKSVQRGLSAQEEDGPEPQGSAIDSKPVRLPRRKHNKHGQAGNAGSSHVSSRPSVEHDRVISGDVQKMEPLPSCSEITLAPLPSSRAIKPRVLTAGQEMAKPGAASDSKKVAEPTVSSGSKEMRSTRLNHRWSASGRKKSLARQNSVEEEDVPVKKFSGAMAIASGSKDSGIESNPRRQRMTSGCSDDSFHTCQTNTNSVSDERPSIPEEIAEVAVDSVTLLPTEMDTLQAKVSRMKIEDFSLQESDDCDSDIDEGGDYSKCVAIEPSSICASDGSIAEYRHTDLETSITLTVARWPLTCAATSYPTQSMHWKSFSELSICSDPETSVAPVTVPKDIVQLSDNVLARELLALGDVPGPITAQTRRVYQLRLNKLRNNPQLCTPSKSCGFSRELQQFVASHPSISLAEISQWEDELVKHFETSSGRKWREGNSKMSFTYILLDPRTTKNLPARHHLLDSEDSTQAFRVFLSAIFYIGKGKKTRPYQHFIEAIKNKNGSAKTKQILDIWKSGLGVVSLHVFHNILPVEAYTREACMVDAIDLKNLTNVAKCSYYGVATTWSSRKRRLVGSDLLNKAYNIILIEGERQIRPADVRDESELPSFLV